MNINTVIIGGNLTANPEVKQFASGSSVCEFSIAVNENWKNDAGEKQERTHFIRCFCYGPRGETIAKYFTKGQRILVEGSLAQETWTEKDGDKKREKTRVKVTGFHFVEKGEKSAAKTESQPESRQESTADQDGDDIPF